MAFFILFLAVFYFRVALGIKVDDPTPGLLIFPFLIFSLLAIGLVRSRGTVQRDFLPGYQIIGVMLGFIVVVLLAGIGVVIFFLPYLTLAAEQGNNLMNILARPFIAILTQVSHWLFGTELDIPAELPVRKTPGPNPSTAWTLPTWLEPLVTILSWIVLALLGIVVLAFVGVMVYIVFRWLFSKTSLNPEQPSSPRETLAAALAQLKALLLSLKRGLARHLQGRRAASHFYAGLASWGRNSGLPRLLYETPLEYSLRLGGRFPVLAGEIELIVESYNREVYGEMVLNEGQLASARSAWRELNRPSYWPMRLKAVFPGRSGETVGAR